MKYKSFTALLAALSLFGSAAYAADCSVTLDGSEYHVEINGSDPDAASLPVTLYIGKAGEILSTVNSDFTYVDQHTADMDGNYKFSINLPQDTPGGEYQYIIKAKNFDPETGSFTLMPIALLTQLSELLKDPASTEEQIKAILEDPSFNVDFPLYGSVSKSFIAKNLKTNAPDTFSGIIAAINKAALTAALNENNSTVFSGSVLQYASYFSLSETDAAYYAEKITTTGLTNIKNNLIGKNFASSEDAEKRFLALIYTNVITNNTQLGTADAETVLKEHGALLGINTMPGNTVIRALVNSTAATPEDLLAVYNNALAGSGSSGGSGGGGSSGGSGGSGSGGSSGDKYITQSNPAVTIPTGSTTVITTSPSPAEQNTERFTDMNDHSWAKTAVYALANRNIINGTSNSTFSPAETVTREAFISMLDRLFDFKPQTIAPNSFTDVIEGEWYYDSVSRAYSLGVVNGISSSLFGTGAPVTRQDMAVMALYALQTTDYKSDVHAASGFTDSSAIASYAKEAVELLSSLSVINGYDDGTFRPADTATRAEAAQIIYRLMSLNTEE